MANFNNTFTTLPPFLFEHVTPTPLTNPKLIHVSSHKEDIGLTLSSDEILNWLNGNEAIPGEQRISTRYAGHQFGVWAGQLGDGRAISLGELLNQGQRFEIQTKGSGLTPFSRMGDGKAVIRSSVREYLCSEAMFGLNIPTSRVLALITGDDPVYRESVERSALVARVFPTNLRFGHFEMCYHFEKKDELKSLCEYLRKYFFNDKSLEEMLVEIVARTAKLMAKWQDVGFCHGVMNTDNMSVLGLTIDYGPFGFLEDTNLSHICNHSDHQGRYAYNQQPSVGMWNLERFLVCFIDLVSKDFLQKTLSSYPAIFEKEYTRLCRKKLGLIKEEADDFKLFISALKMLDQLSIDYTFFWRELSNFRAGDRESLNRIWNYYGNRQELIDWLNDYSNRLKLESISSEERSIQMKKNNPKFILRNYIAQEIIDDVEKGSSEKLQNWLEVLYNPFDEHENFDSYSKPTPSELKNFVVSCSS
jgi:uncharacterized protein YdiU (UPF0061 family)